jgi:hypothetical protein
VEVQGDKLLIQAEAPSEDAKNKAWDAIKKVDASYRDLTADIRVAAGASAGMGGPAGAAPPPGWRSYTVQSGDTLQSIASQLWGDSSLWYKLAEANGIQSDMALTEGRRLNVPAGVSRTHHNASTFRPYDANDAIGNISPTTPKPAKKNGCGMFGQILLIVVAVAVSAWLGPQIIGQAATMVGGTVTKVATGLTAMLGGAGATAGSAAAIGAGVIGGGLAGAAGSIVSQGVGIATGIQDKFNWGAVAMAGISGGIGAGIGAALGMGNKNETIYEAP